MRSTALFFIGQSRISRCNAALVKLPRSSRSMLRPTQPRCEAVSGQSFTLAFKYRETLEMAKEAFLTDNGHPPSLYLRLITWAL